MEREEAIKISLNYQVVVAGLKSLLDTLNATDLNELSMRKQRDVVWTISHLLKADEALDLLSAEIREIETLFDSEDEQAIIDLVCNIEKTLNKTPVPVQVYPEISNILNNHLGEKQHGN